MQNLKSPENFKYDVFLSFRGADTRKTFTNYLYIALQKEGLAIFRDDEEIERGETIQSELIEGIQESRSWIIVFSENYACSRWCLDELELILECRNNSKRPLLPIFYHVDPSDVRRQSGHISEALFMHENKFKRELDDTRRKDLMDKLKRWRNALTQLADLAGLTFPDGTNGYEAEFIEKIVNIVNENMYCNILSVPPHIVGIEESVRSINLWIRNVSLQVEVFALYGTGGVGKTTIAKYIYNTNFQLFDGGSFLESIRGYSEQSDGLVCLQRRFLSDICKGNTPTINNLNDGLRRIKNAVRGRKLLLVFDDVDRVEQLDAIFQMREWFHSGSKIILTTRDVDLLKAREPCTRHAVEALSFRDSLELFSCHAFRQRQSHPPQYYRDYSESILKLCEGLPLALEVLGAYLRNKELDVWRSAVERLEVIPDSKIQKILQISYESLQEDLDRELFLDIACFFNGESKAHVVMILDECKYYTRLGIEKLIDRCLLKIDQRGYLRMHHSIQSMGREIIRQQSPKEPGERSRLWHYKDSLEVLKDETGTRAIEGLALEMNMTNVCQVELRTLAFSMMRKLRLLKLDNVKLNGGYKDFPKKLKWLYWHRCPLKALPEEFPSSSLVAINMQRSKLQKLGQGSMLFKSVKFLNLSHSHDLVKSPNFAELIALEQLILEDCVSLVEIDESIGMAKGLVMLNLKDCKLLKTLPKNIGMVKHLRTLIISGCSNLHELPPEIKNFEYLEVFYGDELDFGNVSYTLSQENKSWWDFIMGWFSRSRTGPQLSLTSLPFKSITKLSLVNCNLQDNDFSEGLFFGHPIWYLDLSKNPICFLPDCFKGLKRLEHLEIRECNQLQTLENIPQKLCCIVVRRCPLLEKVTCTQKLNFILVDYCEKLVEMQSLFKIVPIGEIDSEFINSCGIYDMEVMKRIQIKLYNRHTCMTTRCPIQGIFEGPHKGKAFSIFYPGSRVPIGFTTQHNASSMSFIVSDSKLRYLNTCIVYNLPYGLTNFYLLINNRTKDKIFVFSPACYGIPEDDEYVTWISHLKLGIHEVGPGDEVYISIFAYCISFELKEIGINVVYERQEEAGVHSANPQKLQETCDTTSQTHVEAKPDEYYRGKPIYYVGSCKVCSGASRWGGFNLH